MVIDYIFQFIKGNIALRFLSILNIALLTPLLLRTLGVEDFGYWSYLGGIIMTASLLLSFGTNDYAILYVSSTKTERERSKILYSLLCTRIALTPITLGFIYLIITFEPFNFKVKDDYLPIVLLGALGYSFFILAEIFNRILKLKLYYALQIIWLIANMIAIVYIIFYKHNSYVLMSLEALINGIFAIVIIGFLVKIIPVVRPAFAYVRGEYKKFIALFLNMGIWHLIYMTDRYFLLQYSDAYILGLYGLAGLLIAGLMSFILMPFKQFVLNFISKSVAENDTDFHNKILESFIIAFPIMMMPFVLGLAIYGLPFTRLYGGADFIESQAYIIWLGIGYFMYTHATFFIEKEMMRRKSFIRNSIFLNIGMFIMNIPLNIVLIKTYGGIGAAYATFITLCFACVVTFYMLAKHPVLNYLHHIKPWTVVLCVYALGYTLWDDSYGIAGTFLFSGFSWVLIIAICFAFKKPRELMLWVYENIKQKMA